jgi:hypothetical protein
MYSPKSYKFSVVFMFGGRTAAAASQDVGMPIKGFIRRRQFTVSLLQYVQYSIGILA